MDGWTHETTINKLEAEVQSLKDTLGHREAQLYKANGDLSAANLQNDDLHKRLKICADAVNEFCTALEVSDGKNPETVKAVAYWREKFGEFQKGYTEKPNGVAVDWQCRSLNYDKLCCQKEKGHPGDHRYWDDKIDAQWTEQAALKRKCECVKRVVVEGICADCGRACE